MLWNIEGTPHKILGSIHALKSATILPDWAAKSHVGMKRFVFESDLTKSPKRRFGFNPSGSHMTIPGAKSVYRRAGEIMTSLGKEAVSLEDLLPWAVAYQLAKTAITNWGYTAEHGVDFRLNKIAKSGKAAFGFLEEPGRNSELHELRGDEFQYGIAFLDKCVSDLKSGEGKARFERNISAWFASDLIKAAEVQSEECHVCPVIDEIQGQRNHEWIPPAMKLISEDTPTLFVMGYFHTVGKNNFIDLLSEKGIRAVKIS